MTCVRMTECTVTYEDPERRAQAVVLRAEHGWWVQTLRVKARSRRKGYGSRLLDLLCADADRLGVTLRLAPRPEPGGLVYGELVRWYERRGFVDITGGVWERQPRRLEWESRAVTTSGTSGKRAAS